MAGLDTMFLALLLTVLIPGLQASCGVGRFGESCRYSCNCQGACDQITGSCPGSCIAGWVKGGQLCQKQNVAYKKSASSTTNTGYPDWSPDKAVDGNNNIDGGSGTCFHGNSGRNELRIDLGAEYKLYHIRFYLRNGYNIRISNSNIYVYEGQSYRTCYTFPISIPDNPTDVVCDAETRSLIIENPGTGNRADTPLNICEVEIYQCSSGTYGEDCTNFCHCGSCAVTNGVCTGECYAGWQGDSCDIKCDDTSYGINCGQGCENRKCASGSSSCDRFTGLCNTGCLPGWREVDCTRECDPINYGEACSKLCSVRNCYGTSPCDHVTGSCDSGCKQGWQGTDCLQGCVDSYGFNCNMTCADRKCAGDKVSCDRFTGSCDRCLPGWEGADCSKKCDSLHYGTNCSRQCTDRHCRETDSSCFHVTGRCDQGCSPGWLGDDCIEACDASHYGQDCMRECSSRQCSGVTDCNSTSGQCLQGCQSGWTGIDCGQRVEEGGNGAVVAGVVVGCLLAILVAIIAVVFIRKRRLKQGSASKESHSVDTSNVYANIALADEKPRKSPNLKSKQTTTPAVFALNQGRSLDSDEEYDTDSVCTRDGELEGEGEEGTSNYYNLDGVRRDSAIPVSKLEDTLSEMRENPKMVEEEYRLLPDGFMQPYDESQRAENKSKNRYRGYYPYNYNRIVLRDVTDDTDGDYINASYVDGYQSERKYIAAQGPYKSHLVLDFWRMLWQEGCQVVVMVTGLVETGRMKCLRYWPEESTETYGGVTVTKESETVMADYTITKLSVQHKKEKKRQLVHFHFTSWPDHGVPDTSALLNYMSKVNSTSGQHHHPIVVHCSAGIGRTGTYIAVEGLIQQAATEGAVDVVNFVSKMREQRKNMIQTKEQYHFIYRAVARFVLEGDTVLAADDITKIDPRRVGETTMGNRTVQQHLEILWKEHKETGKTDSILSVSSYRSRSGYLVMTSSPDKEELWEQIYNSDSRSLITWSGNDKKVFPVDKASVSTSRLTVTKRESMELADNILLQKLEIRNNDESEGSVIYHYRLSGKVGELDVSALADSMLQWTNQPERRSSSIVSSSASETRLLVLQLNLLDRLQDDGKMDIVCDMRRLQTALPTPRFTVADVRTCVKLAQNQLESLGVYANL